MVVAPNSALRLNLAGAVLYREETALVYYPWAHHLIAQGALAAKFSFMKFEHMWTT